MHYDIILKTPEEVIYDHPEGSYTISRHLEYIGGHWRTYVHCEVYYFAPSILRHMDETFDRVRAQLPPVVGAFNWRVGRLEDHFMTRFGFEKSGSIAWDDGVERPLWLHRRSKYQTQEQVHKDGPKE